MNFLDIFFTPEYGRVMGPTGLGGEHHTITFGHSSYCFHKRPIKWTKYFDIVSPYGYSGPLNVTPEFLAHFHQYCLDNNIVAEFARLHPFIENHLNLDAAKIGEVYYLDLTKPLDFDKGCKSSIKKALKSGITVVQDERQSDTFAMLYYQTMDRNRASFDYHFPISVIDNFFKVLKGKLFCAYYGNKMVAGIIILTHGEYAHYFLAGSDTGYLKMCPGNLLLSEAITWSKNNGYRIFNLGGGKDDSHASFKRSFSKLSLPFYVYKKVHIPEVYDKLSAGLKGDYFPLYRSVK